MAVIEVASSYFYIYILFVELIDYRQKNYPRNYLIMDVPFHITSGSVLLPWAGGTERDEKSHH